MDDILSDEEKVTFVKQVFHNIADVRHTNAELSRALSMRQAEKYIVSGIGDVMLEHVRNFEPFVEYGAHQVIGKFTFELEKKRNPGFARFVEVRSLSCESKKKQKQVY